MLVHNFLHIYFTLGIKQVIKYSLSFDITFTLHTQDQFTVIKYSFLYPFSNVAFLFYISTYFILVVSATDNGDCGMCTWTVKILIL